MIKIREKRANPRAPYSEPISIQFRDNFWRALTKDISPSGAFIISNTFPKIGAELLITISLPGIEHCQIGGWLRWINPLGFGVQFKPLGVRETHAINKLYNNREIEISEDDLILEDVDDENTDTSIH